MHKLLAIIGVVIAVTGCSSSQHYKYKPTKLNNVTIIRYQAMADNFAHIDFDRFNAILSVTYELPASNLVWQSDLIEQRARHTLCEDKNDTLYQLARKDKLGIRFIYTGDGGKVVGPWSANICTEQT